MAKQRKKRASRNKTITLNEEERKFYQTRLLKLSGPAVLQEIIDWTVHQDLFEVLEWLPGDSVNLLFADPPYNLTKSFNGCSFKQSSLSEYERWLESWIAKLVRVLKSTASIYICGDWRSSTAIHRVINKYFIVRNRITWEREKGRGSKTNWKNSSEDIWFCTVSDDYIFNVEDVKLKRRVIAPYTDKKDKPKDWNETPNGRFRLTHPSNLWTDLTVPFWSMPENTEHPTQKPEKLLAKIILASSSPGDVILDPFLGPGTTSVVAYKLNRHYIGIEIDETYCCLAEKRLDMAKENKNIQGYIDGVFWERNTHSIQKSKKSSKSQSNTNLQLSGIARMKTA